MAKKKNRTNDFDTDSIVTDGDYEFPSTDEEFSEIEIEEEFTETAPESIIEDNAVDSALESVAPKTKREIIIDAIEAGGATVPSLMEAADCSYASVMSILATLRLMGKCAVRNVLVEGSDEATYRFISALEWEQLKAAKSVKAVKAKRDPVSPEKKVVVLEKRLIKQQAALSKAADEIKKSSTDPEGDQLRYDVAHVQVALTVYELSKLKGL